jgi:uncharacterized protein YecE (DUF72 family)
VRLLTGTSGFAYKEWKGSFYPDDLPASGMLRYYAEQFPAVEINNTFYRMPAEKVLRQWAEDVPEDFTFVLKASQQITHRKRLNDAAEPVAFFFRIAGVLGDRLGPILVQLPPNLKKDAGRLNAFLDVLPADARVAFEFRHESWFDDDVFEALRVRGAALCIAHGEKLETPLVATAPWGYLRLRQVAYDDAELETWVAQLRRQNWSDAYVFFKHEDAGTGPKLARRFADLFGGGTGTGGNRSAGGNRAPVRRIAGAGGAPGTGM